MLELEGVRKRRGDRWVLDGVTVTIDKGAIYALLGESGTGKSTLLRCISGLESIDEGKINLGSGGVGIVFQQHHLFAHMTAIENVMEAQVQVAKRSADDARKRSSDLLERLGVAHRSSARPS